MTAAATPKYWLVYSRSMAAAAASWRGLAVIKSTVADMRGYGVETYRVSSGLRAA